MKNLFLFLGAIVIALVSSCSSGNDAKTKTITATSTEFTSGEIAKYVEVVDEPSELSFVEQDGAIPTQFIRLKVKLRMTKDGLKDVDARDIDFTSLLSVAVINIVDESGTKVIDLSVKDEELLKLKKLLTGNEGTTDEIVFEGQFHNHDDAPKWFEQASQFTPYLTADISVGSSSDEGVSAESSETDDEVLSDEESSDGEAESSISNAGSTDWDELLDSYEQYVDKYIKFARKAANGDMNALSEYPALLEKAKEFSEKMENAQSEMSASQWGRYMRITTKMTQAASRM